jgi:hypothetical protein
MEYENVDRINFIRIETSDELLRIWEWTVSIQKGGECLKEPVTTTSEWLCSNDLVNLLSTLTITTFRYSDTRESVNPASRHTHLPIAVFAIFYNSLTAQRNLLPCT